MQHNFPNIRTNFPWEILSGPCLYLVHIENKNQEIYFDLFLILGIPAKPKAVELGQSLKIVAKVVLQLLLRATGRI